jgi:hypothetical protein
MKWLFLLALLVSLVSATDPVLTFVNQTPSDVSSTNVFSTPLIIYYNITSLAVNNFTAVLCYKTNSTVSDITAIYNGTADIGWECDEQGSNQTDILYKFQLEDNEIYPHTENYQDSILRTQNHTQATPLLSASDYHLTRIMNVTTTDRYGFYEAMFNSTTGTGVRVYTCNSSYSVGAPSGDANCAQIASVISNGPYDHCHPDTTTGNNYSCHRVITYAINTTTNTISGVKVTPNMSFILRGNTGAVVSIYGANVQVRPDAEQHSANNGNTWANLAFTLDSHLHQFTGNETLRYYPCVNITNGSTYCATGADNHTDLIELGGLPPRPPMVYSPSNIFYLNGSVVPINYTSAVSPNGYDIVSYNITLNYGNGSFNSTLVANNSPNLGYLWNTSGVVSGLWEIKVTACDNNSLCANGTSEIFKLSDSSISTKIIYPPDGGEYGPAQCSQIVSVQTNDSEGAVNRSIACRFYNWNGWANTSYTLNATLYADGGNASVNLTIPVSSPPNWIVNCTTTVNGLTAETQSVRFTNLGNGPVWCNANGTAATTDSTEYPIVALIILAITLILVAGYWENIHIFLAPLGNFLAILGLVSLTIAFLGILLLTPSGAYDTAFTAAVFAFVVAGFYLGLRMVMMAWETLRRTLWR